MRVQSWSGCLSYVVFGSTDASWVSKAETRDVVDLAPQPAGTCHVFLTGHLRNAPFPPTPYGYTKFLYILLLFLLVLQIDGQEDLTTKMPRCFANHMLSIDVNCPVASCNS